ELKQLGPNLVTTWNYGSCGSFGFSTAQQDTGTVVNLSTAQLESFHKARDAATADMINGFRAEFDQVSTKLGDYFAKTNYKDKSGAEINKALEAKAVMPHNIGPLMNQLAQEWNNKVASEVHKLFDEQEHKER